MPEDVVRRPWTGLGADNRPPFGSAPLHRSGDPRPHANGDDRAAPGFDRTPGTGHARTDADGVDRAGRAALGAAPDRARTGKGAALARAAAALPAFAPWLFVALWSTGFIGAKYGLPDAGPFTFLVVRMQIAWVLLAALALARRATWPRTTGEVAHLAVAGLLLHAGYLGGVFFAISRGLPAGLASLIVGLQPVLTAVGARTLLRERVAGRQWLGLGLGFGGVSLVVGEQARATGERPIAAAAFAAIAVALVSTTAGTLYQKRFGGPADLSAGAAVQYLAAGAALAPLAAAEGWRIAWSGRFLFALAWLVLVLSLGATLLLLALIRQHAVSRVAGLLYLVPPATAIEAYLLFGERLGAPALAGMVVVAAGVALVVRQPKGDAG
ncbi:MAG: Permease of the drug/metabolite transporter (DMT) superfamily [uncultured Thermomicrobiales bacterium]|uniref:Permease of the drug/metabolite transporter (DMT) superfamily n=1 Tax=uncultured Thermomicrobiales bacterium TaxID=1645740 RepID=A0A6J4VBL8_9BACT|nr:MAG: Permease of the drug/metabolite transporter (DMT) superfamily [uncultured Thermomicrobiales bacterium]